MKNNMKIRSFFMIIRWIVLYILKQSINAENKEPIIILFSLNAVFVGLFFALFHFFEQEWVLIQGTGYCSAWFLWVLSDCYYSPINKVKSKQVHVLNLNIGSWMRLWFLDFLLDFFSQIQTKL